MVLTISRRVLQNSARHLRFQVISFVDADNKDMQHDARSSFFVHDHPKNLFTGFPPARE